MAGLLVSAPESRKAATHPGAATPDRQDANSYPAGFARVRMSQPNRAGE